MVVIEYNYKDGSDVIEIEDKIALKDLLKRLNINVQEVIVKRNEDVVLEDEEISNDDKIKIFKIVSGG